MNFDWGIWKQIQEIDDEEEFIDDSERRVFLEYLKDPSMVLMEMANVIGNDVIFVNRRDMKFSFYFSTKTAVHNQHGIRVKVVWNPSRALASADGYFELHGDYEYIRVSKKYKVPKADEEFARQFFKKFKVLFAAVWEEKLDPSYLQYYLTGKIKWNEMLSKFYDVSEKQYYLLNHCKNLIELEQCVRKNKIFNMND